MIRVIANGEKRYRLESARGIEIGWIRRQAIAFRGPRSVPEALDAVAVAWSALEPVLGVGIPAKPRRAVAAHQLRLVHDGAYEWVSDGLVPLARVYRPPADRPDGELTIEFVLPADTEEDAVIAAARLLATVLRSHLARRAEPPRAPRAPECSGAAPGGL